MGSALLFLFDAVIQIIILVVIVSAILSWLIAFDVLNMRNATVARIMYALVRMKPNETRNAQRQRNWGWRPASTIPSR